MASSLISQIDKSMITLKDLKNLMIKKIPENASPYDRQSIEYNHRLLNDFLKDMVQPNLKGGKIECGHIDEMWNIYQEGKETEIMYSMRDQLFQIPKESVEYWRKVFELPVEEMLKLGKSTLLYGYDILSLWYRRWIMDMKYQQFFSNPDPLRWLIHKDDIKDFEANTSKFTNIDIKKYMKKMMHIMNNKVQIH